MSMTLNELIDQRQAIERAAIEIALWQWAMERELARLRDCLAARGNGREHDGEIGEQLTQ
jgi:hypothetical protein